jgi:Holliday junction resolvase
MPNSNYNRGRAREYQVMHTLRNEGWVCSRSAMSHGPVDVFAARAGRVRLIQVKSGSARINRQELQTLKSFAVAFNADAEVWSFPKKGKIKKVIVSRRVSKKFKLPDNESVMRPLQQSPITIVEPMSPTS